MKRRLLFRALVGAAALGVGIPAGSGRPGAVQANIVPLVVPPAQSVAIEAVNVRVKGSVRPTLKLDGAAFAPGSTAMVAVRTASTGGSTTVMLFAVTVSRDTRKNRPAAARFEIAGAPGVPFLLAAVPTAKPDAIWRANQRDASAVGLVETGSTPPARGVAFRRVVGQVLAGWDPLAKPELLNADDVQIRLYDVKHPTGRSEPRGPAVRSATGAGQLLQDPIVSVRDDIYKQIDETSACILGRLTCRKYAFSFTSLQETIVRSDQPRYRLTTHYTGRTCGRSLLGQPWRITTQSGKDRPVTRTVDLRKRNDVFTTVPKVKGVGSGTAIHKLGPQPGAFPGMQALVDSTGVWSSDAGGVTVPVTVTKLPAGSSC